MKAQHDKKTFIVDDDPFWTAMLTQMLAGLGYSNVVSFSNGADCIKHLHLHPQLIFLDYQMAGMDGLEVLQKIKKYNTDIVVVFCTEQKDLRIAVRAMKNGSFDYLVKSNSTSKELSLIIESMEEKLVFVEKVF